MCDRKDLGPELDELWTRLERELEASPEGEKRLYRRLELDPESGLRLGVVSPGKILELLIQIGSSVSEEQFSPPRWMGMRFERIQLDVPESGTTHIRLYLKEREHRPVFVTVCSDIARSLLRSGTPSGRIEELQECLHRWSRFFQRYGLEGLPPEVQRGLFGELTWLNSLLKSGMKPVQAIESWKGGNRAYHDFETDGRVLEVKTTMTKEPRHVRINNERQLDDRGLRSLHLFVLTLHKIDTGGQTLPELVEEIRGTLKGHTAAEARFEKLLRDAGYLDVHVHIYTSGYIRKKLETFEVREGFPRIIDPPAGVGGLSYSLTVSACLDFEVDMERVLQEFIGEERNG